MTTATQSKVKIRPLGELILIRRNTADEKTPGGIVLPEQAKEKPTRGIVFAVGSGRLYEGKRIPLEIQRGEEVIFSTYAGTEIEVEGEKFTALREQDILAVVSPA